MPSVIAHTSAPPTGQALLTRMSKKIVANCPDMREMARDAAREILRLHYLDYLEPDAVYWHRFERTESSPRTFNGWQHLDPPIESLTLPQLVMQRFNAQDQDGPDALQVSSGFYTAGPEQQVFDETNEVRLLPQEVLKLLWSVDFKTRFKQKSERFWRDCADDFRTLAKANFIAKAIEDHHSSHLTHEQLASLMAALGINLAQPVDLSLLQSRQSPGADTRIATLDIAGYEASDILRIVQPNGRQFLYIPGETTAFQVFDTDHDLQWWLMTHTNHAGNRARFMSHFPLSTHATSEYAVGLNHALDMMFANWGPYAVRVVNRSDHTITQDPFTHLRDAMKSRIQADADFALHSNSELRKQMWMGYLKAFGKTFGALAALDWPIALAAVGAGLADVGLSVDQAMHGHTTAERKSGIIGAILGSIDVLLNSAFVFQAALPEIADVAIEPEPDQAADLTPDPPSVARVPAFENPAPTPAPAYSAQADMLAPFETNEIPDEFTPPPAEGRMRAIYQNEHGETFIDLNGGVYQVRFVSELSTWTIIDPQNPFSFYRNIPVRLDSNGTWQLMASQGLRGGGKGLSTLSGARSRVTPSINTVPSPYDMPQDLRETLRARVESPSNKPFSGDYASLTETDPIDTFFAVRERLMADADAFYAHLRLTERAALPTIARESSPKTALKQLYDQRSGLVIGESHSSVASKRFLIDNMALLAKQHVNTLYMEHLLTDLHQADLNIFASTGRMPVKLQSYLEDLDWGHFTDSTGTYTFENLVKTANRFNIRIRAIDCMTSYRVAGVPDAEGTARLKMMNYFAHTVIAADKAAVGSGKWIALVGNAHANTFKGIAGVAELEDVIGLRIQDVTAGETGGFELDPGEDVTTSMGNPAGRVASDIRLRMLTTGVRTHFVRASTSFESRLPNPGNFAIQRSEGSPQLIYRTPDGQLAYLPIRTDDDGFYIQFEQWPLISGRRFESFEALAAALKLTGMQ